MSVRRLAEEEIQPRSFAFSLENADWAMAKIKEYPEGRQASAVIPLLWRAQEQEGWVTRPAIETVAGMLDMPYIRVLEIATFYTQFQLQPVGSKAHIQVCGTTPCMLRGAEDIRAVCQKKIHPEAHHLNEDGSLSWEEVECMGACVNAPMVAIGNDTYEDLTPERIEEIIDAFASGKGDSIEPGPQNGRIYAAAITGPTTLTEVPEHKSTSGRANGSGQAATVPGNKRKVTEESAPAVKGPRNARKISESEAEGERKATSDSATATGTPNTAERPGAHGGESPAGKRPETRLEQIFDTPEGAADDLKLISGIGPGLEKKLNDLGVMQYAQIAAFDSADIEKLDDALKFRGRIARDAWIEQAKALAKGGVEEYERVFGRKPR